MNVGYMFAHHFKERKDIFILELNRGFVLLFTKQIIMYWYI